MEKLLQPVNLNIILGIYIKHMWLCPLEQKDKNILYLILTKVISRGI